MSGGDLLQNGNGITSERKLYLETPTIHSGPISKVAGFDVYLKLENLQIPGSFKIRGISNLCKKKISDGFQQSAVEKKEQSYIGFLENLFRP